MRFIESLIPNNTFDFVLWELFIIVFLIQILYYLFFYVRVFSKEKKTNVLNDVKIPISVVICAKNEAENLKNFLPKILTQDYPNFEVIVVNDCSTDNTTEILSELKNKHKKLYYTNIEYNPNFPHGKKLALTVGIKAAKNEYIVFTDADCYPTSNQWISSIAKNYKNKKTQIVLAYGAYEKRKGLLNKIIRFDTLFIAIQYLTFAKAGIAYMGTGRNMSYKKSLYEKQKGFSSHYHILSGDDDLFINKAANKKNVTVTYNPNSFTYSLPKVKFKNFKYQKKRHLSTGKHYKFFHKILLGGEIISRFLFYLLFLLSLAFKINMHFAITLLLIRMLVQILIIAKASKVFNEKYIFLLSPIFDIILPLINLKIVILNFFKKNRNQSWK